jgi:adenosylcobinamide-phosphate synthase
VSFWCALLALAADWLAPLYRPSQFERLAGRYAGWVHDHFNAGSHGHGLLAWCAAALVPALAVGLAGRWLAGLAWPLGLAWSAAVLYQCLGFRQVADLARGLAGALAAGDGRRLGEDLAALGVECGPGSAPAEAVRPAMDRLFQLGLERLFGVLFWFALLGGFGALAYALTRLLAERWHGEADFHAAVAEVVPVLDWLPARLLAMSFAVVGNFEEALLAWRAQPAEAGAAGIVRAAGLGALGLERQSPGPAYVAAVASLLRRSLLLWLGVLGLFWLGGL